MLRGLAIVAAAVALVVIAGAADAEAPVSGWLGYGNDVSRQGFVPTPATANPAALKLIWTRQVDGHVIAQPLVLRNFPTPGETRIVIGTSTGKLYVLNQNGFVVGMKQLGSTKFKTCFSDWGNMGIGGTPTIDPATRTLYVPDGAGYVHALDLATLKERPGWPVRLYRDVHLQMMWGALTLAGGRVYAVTGLLCEAAATHAYSIDLKTRKVRAWSPVPLSLGGGGGMWGWGGLAYDAPTKSLLVATGDALPGGKNKGKAFNESSAYAEHIVRFNLNLRVEASHTPLHYRTFRDDDFSSTPVVLRASGCPALVVAEDKNGALYVYRLNAIRAGLYQKVQLAPHLNGQPAWSPLTRSVYVVGDSRYYRLSLTSRCRLKTTWSLPLPTRSVNGPPLVAGNVVWFAASDNQTVWAVDAKTGKLLKKLAAAEAVFAPPTPLDGRVYVAGWQGLIAAYG